eukprot:15365288-Ditylum_brightwellii.AAC.1
MTRGDTLALVPLQAFPFLDHCHGKLCNDKQEESYKFLTWLDVAILGHNKKSCVADLTLGLL